MILAVGSPEYTTTLTAARGVEVAEPSLSCFVDLEAIFLWRLSFVSVYYVMITVTP